MRRHWMLQCALRRSVRTQAVTTLDSDSEDSKMVAVAGGLISLTTHGNVKIATTMTGSKAPHSTFLASGEYQVEGNIFFCES